MPDNVEAQGLKVYTDNDGVEYWSIRDRQLDQGSANYNTIGGNDERACASCQWFINPAGCVVVESYPDPIVATGLSDLYKERVRPDLGRTPIPVVIVDLPEGQSAASEFKITVPKALKEALFSGINGVLDTLIGKPSIPLKVGKGQSFITFKDMNEQWRWFAWTSNKFRDLDNPPEIFEDSAHKDYVKYLDDGGQYPELWLWHEPGTRWGEADWADYADGFLMHSGTVDPGNEDVAQALAKQKDLGVSHGYHFLHSDEKNGIIGWYRTFEVSPMFMKAAANPWTGIAMLQKELGEMGFNAEKRAGLVELVGEDVVTRFEGRSKDLAAELTRLGVEYKGKGLLDDDGTPADGTPTDGAPADGTPADSDANKGIDYKALGEEAAKALSELPAFKTLTDGVTAVQTDITGIKGRLDALEQSDDAKIAAALKPKVQEGTVNGKGYQASNATDNNLDKDDDAAKAGAHLPSDAAFFNEVVEQVAGPAQQS